MGRHRTEKNAPKRSRPHPSSANATTTSPKPSPRRSAPRSATPWPACRSSSPTRPRTSLPASPGPKPCAIPSPDDTELVGVITPWSFPFQQLMTARPCAAGRQRDRRQARCDVEAAPRGDPQRRRNPRRRRQPRLRHRPDRRRSHHETPPPRHGQLHRLHRRRNADFGAGSRNCQRSRSVSAAHRPAWSSTTPARSSSSTARSPPHGPTAVRSVPRARPRDEIPGLLTKATGAAWRTKPATVHARSPTPPRTRPWPSRQRATASSAQRRVPGTRPSVRRGP